MLPRYLGLSGTRELHNRQGLSDLIPEARSWYTQKIGQVLRKLEPNGVFSLFFSNKESYSNTGDGYLPIGYLIFHFLQRENFLFCFNGVFLDQYYPTIFQDIIKFYTFKSICVLIMVIAYLLAKPTYYITSYTLYVYT